MSNCHTTNPVGSFSIDANASNNPAGKGIIVNINLPSDQTGYELESDSDMPDRGGQMYHEITLKASTTSAPGGVLPVILDEYTRDDGGQGAKTLNIQLNVFLQVAGSCQKKKEEEKPLVGTFKKG